MMAGEREKTPVDELHENPGLTDEEVQFPPRDVMSGNLNTRGPWMEVRGETWRFSVESRGKLADIRLEGWVEGGSYHHLLCEYGQLYRPVLKWDEEKIAINILAIHDKIPLEDMPALIEVGRGNAYTVSMEAFNSFRDRAGDVIEEDEVSVSKRLLFHAIIDRNQEGMDGLRLEWFSQWPLYRILAVMDSHFPGMWMRRFSKWEAGLVYEKIEKKVEKEEKGEKEKEEEQVKEKNTLPAPSFVEDPVEGEEAEKSIKKIRGKKRRRGRKGKKGGVTRSPIKLTIEQERAIIKLLVQGANPNATEAEIKFNQDHVAPRPEGVPNEEQGYTAYGSGPGGWSLTAEDLMDGPNGEMMLQSGNSSKVSEMFESTISPRGELSQFEMSSTAGTLGTGSPVAKRRREMGNVSIEEIKFSPFLARKGGRVVTISSSSSEDELRGLNAVKMNLSELLNSGSIEFPDNGVASSIVLYEEDHVDVKDKKMFTGEGQEEEVFNTKN